MGKQATEVSYALINRTRARARFTVNAHAKWSNTICMANAAEDVFSSNAKPIEPPCWLRPERGNGSPLTPSLGPEFRFQEEQRRNQR